MSTRSVEVTPAQVADLARRLAVGFGHIDPDIMVAPGPALRVATPFTCAGELYAVPREEHGFPLWQVFNGAAMEVLAEAGRLADVTFVVLETRTREAA